MESPPPRAAPSNLSVAYRFGLFELEPSGRRLLKQGRLVRLQDQPFQLLVALVERNGDIVTRETLRQLLWPGDTFVDFDKSLGVAVTKLRDALGDDAGSPTFIETVSRHGYRFIAPVSRLDGQPSILPAPAVALQSPAPPAAASTRARNNWLKLSLSLLALAVVTLAAVHYLRPAPKPPAQAVASDDVRPPTPVRRSIAVLGFRNLQGRPEDAWLSAALSEMLSTELASTSQCRLVSGEDVAQAKRDLPLADEDTLSRATLLRLRTNPGADVVVLGSYAVLPENGAERLRFDLRVQDTASGETISEQALVGNEQNLFDLAAQAGARLRQALGMNPNPSGTPDPSRASLPSNQTALRLYTEGRAKLFLFDFLSARDLLSKAIAADPAFPLAHAALSDVWWHTGYDAKARVEARRALELSNQLSQEQRLLVEGQYQRTVEEWPKAVETYRSLFRLFPDNLDYGLLFASAQMHLSAADSLQTLAVLRQLPPPLGNDARIDMTEASAWINRDFTKARAAAKLAIEKATTQGSPVIVSRTYGILCQQEPSISASTEAINICRNALEAALADKDLNGEAMMRTDLAVLYYLRGDIAESAQMFQQAVKKFRQVGNRDGVATALSNFADARISQGDLLEAKQLLEVSIQEYQAVDDKEGAALNLDSLGDIWRQNGAFDKAETAYRKAEVIAQQIEDTNATAYVLNGLGDLALDRGNLASARKSYEEALGLRNQAGERQTATESRVSLAKLAIEEGHASDAEASARECKEQFHKEQQADDELSASIVLIDALLAQGKQSEAQKEMGAAQKLGSATQNRFFHLQFELASGRVLLASDHPDASRALLQRVAGDAHHYGFVGLEFADELALAELANKTKHGAQAQIELHALQKSAASKGFGLIGRQALREVSALGNQIGTP